MHEDLRDVDCTAEDHAKSNETVGEDFEIALLYFGLHFTLWVLALLKMEDQVAQVDASGNCKDNGQEFARVDRDVEHCVQ